MGDGTPGGLIIEKRVFLIFFSCGASEGDETDDEADLPEFDSSPSLSDGDVASLLSSIADSRSDVSNAEEESDFLSFLTELERVESD